MQKMDLGNSKKISKSWPFRQSEKKYILLIGDFLAASLALIVAIYFWAQPDWLRFSTEFLQQRIPGWYYFLPLIWIVLMVELYDNRKSIRKDETIRGLTVVALISLGLYLLVYFTSEPSSLPRRGVASFIVAAYIFTLLWRLFFIRTFSKAKFLRRVLIIGAGRAGTEIAGIIKSMWPPPFFVVGIIDDDPEKIGTLIEGFPVLAPTDNLIEVALAEGVSDLIFAITNDMRSEMIEIIMKAEEIGIQVNTMPVIYEELLGRVPIRLLGSEWLLRSFVDQSHASSIYDLVKRLIDIIGSLFGMLGLLLILPFVTLAILIDTGFPIFYKQDRVGENGRIFEIIKFRTMFRDAEKSGQPLMAVRNDNRITTIGKFLRKSHLDEVPQFINVFLGDISLVGPRAERLQLVERYHEEIPFYRARLFVKPGLTGWAQVNFGYASTIEESITKLEYDLYYIKHRNLAMEISILLRTIGTVVGLRGQ